jgi:hypothetical protein
MAKNVAAAIDDDGTRAGTTSSPAGKPDGSVERDYSFYRITFASPESVT